MSESTVDPEIFAKLLPLVTAWAEQHEARILAQGEPLTPAQTADARKIGVVAPENVRLLSVDTVPMPEHPLLRTVGEAAGIMSSATAGLTLRYGIYIRSDLMGDRHLVAHELVHTAQYERCGTVREFLRQYLYECLTVGYSDSPMEQEAVFTSERILGAGT